MVKNIFVSGGANGLGKSIIENLSQLDGVEIWFTYCNSKDEATNIEKTFPNSHAIHCDFKSPESVDQCCKTLDFIAIDCLINNAYVGPLKEVHFHNIDKNFISESFANNIMPVLEITQFMIRKFRKQKNGKIITVLSSSILSQPSVGWSIYNSEKNYLLSMSKSWAVENAKFNIVSNCISPTFMDTNIHAHRDPYTMELIKSNLGSILTTQECAENVAYFVQCNHQVNGVNLPINGGSK